MQVLDCLASLLNSSLPLSCFPKFFHQDIPSNNFLAAGNKIFWPQKIFRYTFMTLLKLFYFMNFSSCLYKNYEIYYRSARVQLSNKFWTFWMILRYFDLYKLNFLGNFRTISAILELSRSFLRISSAILGYLTGVSRAF